MKVLFFFIIMAARIMLKAPETRNARNQIGADSANEGMLARSFVASVVFSPHRNTHCMNEEPNPAPKHRVNF